VYVLIAAVQGDFPQLQDRFPTLLQNLSIMVVRARGVSNGFSRCSDPIAAAWIQT